MSDNVKHLLFYFGLVALIILGNALPGAAGFIVCLFSWFIIWDLTEYAISGEVTYLELCRIIKTKLKRGKHG